MLFDLYQLFFIFCLKSILFNRHSNLICLFLWKILNFLVMKIVSYLCDKFHAVGGTPLEYEVYRHLVSIEIQKHFKNVGPFIPSSQSNLKFKSLT